MIHSKCTGKKRKREKDDDKDDKKASSGGDDGEKKILTSTRNHDQHDSGLCWAYACSSSIRKSLRFKLGKTLFKKKDLTELLKASLPDSDGKDKALKFISHGDHHQILRKEIHFYLRPTTLTGLFIL